MLALHVRTLGERGQVIVLLHGLAGSERYYGAAFDALASDARLVVPDLLGFGKSPKPPSGYGPDQHSAALGETLDALGVDAPVLLVGHSAGALVALAFARRNQ